ncbi:hypothetical protein BH18ACI2_BH18ACI2_04890 [soil metagenome]
MLIYVSGIGLPRQTWGGEKLPPTARRPQCFFCFQPGGAWGSERRQTNIVPSGLSAKWTRPASTSL